jgi:hypothetical protein
MKGKREMWILGRMMVSLLFLWVRIAEVVAGDKGILVVDSFSQGAKAGGTPNGWAQEKTPGSSSKIAIEGEKENHYLHLLSVGDAFGLRKDISFDIRKYPYLSWQWKVSKLPQGGDIRKRETDDQAGQVYVLFPKWPNKVNTRSVGYIWDCLAPVGLSGTSTAYRKMKYVVLESGAAKLNEWVSERRNVYEDYKNLFQETPPTVGGLLLYINSQHTRSSAECFYANIFFSANPPDNPRK